MQRLVRTVALCLLAGVLGQNVSCKEDPPRKSGEKRGGETAVPQSPSQPSSPAADPTPSPSRPKPPRVSDDCDKKSQSSTEDSEKEFGLVETKVDYKDDIKSILAEKCIDCHSSDGGKRPYLSNFEEVKNAKSKIVALLESKEKHPEDGTPLTASQKAKIESWVASGMLEDSEESSTDDDEDKASDKSSDDVDDCESDAKTEGGEEDDEAAWDELINPAEMKKCLDDDLLYDRAALKCHRAKVATSYKCRRSDIIDTFKSVNVDVSKEISNFEGEGYVIDQCGEYKGDPIVLFYKKGEKVDNSFSLKVRKICKKNSEVCTNP